MMFAFTSVYRHGRHRIAKLKPVSKNQHFVSLSVA